uniref:MPL proto-oncogene, thrombopoietin receptor n=1 Tax=Myripristis murdjan TaxID=586833 RepID=A0A668ARP4_9TELE
GLMLFYFYVMHINSQTLICLQDKSKISLQNYRLLHTSATNNRASCVNYGADVLLLKDEEDPKCFSRTQHDFTCFFETKDDGIYNFSYKIEDEYVRTEEETFLHICTFPSDDVFLYILIHLKVAESSTNTTLFTRSVSVEDQFLLDAPVDVSLHNTDQAGELQATWSIQTKWETQVVYMIRYSSRRLGEKKDISRLVSLVPGELLHFQIRVKHHLSKKWSHWTDPVRAMVPQSADDISLLCYTSDLRSVTCEWNENTYGRFTYKLFYKTSPSRATDWTECVSDGNLTGLCRFHGDESREVQVKLSNGSTPFSRTFYSQPFSVNSIKPSPPGHLTGKLQRGRLCLTWDAPPLPLLAHLQYQVSYQPRQDADWTVFLTGPEAATCLEVPTGCRYRAQVRAKPNGAGYSGHWSDWSQEITGDIPTDTNAFLILCIPVLLLIVTIVFISMYFSKLKRYFWPPVPNLDKVLQGFLTEINRKTLDPIFTAKQFYDETPASVVVVVVKSEDEASGPGSPLVESDRLLSAAQGSSGGEQVDGSPEEVSPDYVTLSTDNVARCPKGNEYVYEQAGECGGLGLTDRVNQTTCHCSYTGKSFSVPSCTSSDHLNRSYLPLAESVDKLHCQVAATRGPGNLYVNF